MGLATYLRTPTFSSVMGRNSKGVIHLTTRSTQRDNLLGIMGVSR